MGTALFVVHVVLCLVLMGIVLLQQGKGASMGATFGGGSQTIFGGRGPATFFQKMTTMVALGFLVTSLGLAKMARAKKGESVIQAVPAPVTAPVTPETTTPETAPATPESTAPAPAPVEQPTQ